MGNQPTSFPHLPIVITNCHHHRIVSISNRHHHCVASFLSLSSTVSLSTVSRQSLPSQRSCCKTKDPGPFEALSLNASQANVKYEYFFRPEAKTKWNTISPGLPFPPLYLQQGESFGIEPTLFVGEAKLLNVTSNETIKTAAEQQHELHRNRIWFYFCDNSSSTD